MKTCPTCYRPTDAASEGIVQAVIATRPMAGPAQARHIAHLERRVAELTLALMKRGRVQIVRKKR